MKELSIEQKAKRYDEAIKRLEDVMTGKCQKTFMFTKGLFDYIFPELKKDEENGDDNIRKALIEMVNDTVGDSLWIDYNVHKEDAIAWLEKQGEKKHQYNSRPRYVGEVELLGKKAAKIEPKFKVSDKIQYKNKTYTIKEVQENYYVLDNNMSLGFYAQDVWELVEPKYAEIVKPKFKDGDWVVYQNETFQVRSFSNGSLILQGEKYQTYFIAELCRAWTIQDAKDGDILACDTNIIIYGGYINNYGGRIGDKAILAYCGWNDEKLVINKKKTEGFGGMGYVPATKEQRDLLFKKMKEAGYEWDAENKELKKLKE